MDYTVTTTPDEQAALEWVAAGVGQTPQVYLDTRVHEVLHSYEQQHAVATAVAPVDDVAVAYAKADAATQTQVSALLGVEATR